MRRAAELTQAEIAEAAGVSRQTIVAIERGDYAPSVYLALALGECLHTSVEALFAAPPSDTQPAESGGTDVGRPS
jgi:putative transcriptional regulator